MGCLKHTMQDAALYDQYAVDSDMTMNKEVVPWLAQDLQCWKFELKYGDSRPKTGSLRKSRSPYFKFTVKFNLGAFTELRCYLATMGPSHVQSKLPMESFWGTCIMV